MYQNIHRRLTFLFTGISSLILIVMSVSYLYMSEKSLKNNSFLSFSGEMNTLISNFEQQTTITHEWLSKVSGNGKYQIAVYDNGIPLDFTSTALSEKTRSLVEEVRTNCADTIQSILPKDSFSSPHKEFTYTSNGHGRYYVCYVNIQRASDLTAIILYSTAELSHQLIVSRFRFFAIDLVGILLLFLFSRRYTKRLLAPIQKSQEQQAAFIAAASHELRTPLTVILSCLSAIRSRQKASGFPDTEQEHFLRTMETESNHMSQLVTDLLTLARADNHTWSFHMKETDLDTILLNACEAFQPMAREKQISLQIRLPEGHIPPCSCDPERILQVLSVLLSNAISYGAGGGTIHLTLNHQNGVFTFQVIDHGIGIPDAEKTHIFERFYRVDSSHSGKEHFGLGLCIAKEIIEAHRGDILVSDTPGGGTTFTIRLYSRSPAF